jgi:hypothetical protein
MYHVDNPCKLVDNLRNQVNNSIDPWSSAAPQRNLNSLTFVRFETPGNVAEGKMLGGSVSGTYQGNGQVVQQC